MTTATAPAPSVPRPARPTAPAGLRDASAPPEARGLARDEVRLVVARPGSVVDTVFRSLPDHLDEGDLVVVNTSATLPAAVDAVRPSGAAAVVHFSTELDDGTWVVEVRPAGRATGPVGDLQVGERLLLDGGAPLDVVEVLPGQTRLARAQVRSEGGAVDLLQRSGRPISYAYVDRRWPLEAYQTVFAREPGSAEMPSAARPFTADVVTALVARGIAVAPVVLHTGVSSAEPGEPPQPERYRVPAATARLVERTRLDGGRVVAVGTTVARALETVADDSGAVRPGAGWTDLVLGPERPARVVDGLVTGWHPRGASHLRLLEAVAGSALVAAAYEVGERLGLLQHEFGDSCLLLP